MNQGFVKVTPSVLADAEQELVKLGPVWCKQGDDFVFQNERGEPIARLVFNEIIIVSDKTRRTYHADSEA
jgi:hypothetical protein